MLIAYPLSHMVTRVGACLLAGALIVKEAGGTVTDYQGSEDFTQGNSVVATNGIIQQDLLSAIRTA